MTKAKKRTEEGEGLGKRIVVHDSVLVPREGGPLTLSWKIAFTGALAALILLPLTKPSPYWDVLKFVGDGFLVTLQVTILATLFATIMGLFVGLCQLSSRSLISHAATVYVEIVRGVPLLVQLFYLQYVLGLFLNKLFGRPIPIEGVTAAVIAISLCYGAYIAEIFRAGLQSIPRGQMEAALALGLSRRQAIKEVILPQAVRVILPAIGNEFIALLKDSSLVSILAVSDLLRRGKEYASVTFEYFEALTLVALIYLVTTLFLSRMVGLLEKSLRRG